MNLLSNNVSGVQASVLESSRLHPIAGGTKPALSTPREGVTGLDMSPIRGIIEYQPDEFTFSAYAGTRIADVNELLQENKQYLPFDPPLVKWGATLGGTVASGLSGPGRYHYGGIRDFLLGVKYINGTGQIVQAGGKVVKNAAGFDLAKLMVGCRGVFGPMIELSFKVFPKPEQFATFRREFPNLDSALQMLKEASISQLDIDSIDLVPDESGTILWIRIGGLASAVPSRVIRMVEFLGDCEVFQDSKETNYWEETREFLWVPPDWSLVKVPLTPRLISSIEQKLVSIPIVRRYSCAGQVGWFAIPGPPTDLNECLLSLNLSGMPMFGFTTSQVIGKNVKSEFYRQVKNAMDPENRFGEA
ncbi:FAD-binding protein [Chloroflexota bacterium]